MGVERSVTRWYLQRQSLMGEIARLEAGLAPSSPEATTPPPLEAAQGSDEPQEVEKVERQLAEARAKLKSLGHCPKPMMG